MIGIYAGRKLLTKIMLKVSRIRIYVKSTKLLEVMASSYFFCTLFFVFLFLFLNSFKSITFSYSSSISYKTLMPRNENVMMCKIRNYFKRLLMHEVLFARNRIKTSFKTCLIAKSYKFGDQLLIISFI